MSQHSVRGRTMDNILAPDEGKENRTSRMSVLAWHPKDGKVCNIFTHIRHRRADGMGPWAGEPDGVWRTTTFPSNGIVQPGEVKLHLVDAPLAHCLELVKDILDKKAMAVEGLEVFYALEQPALGQGTPMIARLLFPPLPSESSAGSRRTRGGAAQYRNHWGTDDHSVSSPFTVQLR